MGLMEWLGVKPPAHLVEDGGAELAPMDPGEVDDRLVLRILAENGANLELPRTTRHHFYFATEDAANEVSKALTADHFTVTVEQIRYDQRWKVLAEHETVINPAVVPGLRSRMTALSRLNGGTYDGWDASATP